ncbi:hypothetical protein BJ170DRAFT_698437 [Xylariales sp. AK1849]|nr:hypothetical protein BJ170DRAFT_698437 [Xylariales sp. AK1849]
MNTAGTMLFVFALLTAVLATAIAPPSPNSNVAHPHPAAGLQARQQAGVECGTGFPSATSAWAIDQGIADLRERVNEECGAEPGECKMLQCSYNAGIQWCNHNDHYASWKCHDFAVFAQSIRDQCTDFTSWTNSDVVQGRAFDEQHFEVWYAQYAQAAARMTSPRTLLGPLTETYTFPPVCQYAMASGCASCSTGWLGQTCNTASGAHDWTDCWPPRASSMMDPGVMMGWGFYSPGLACPQGYTTAAVATEGGSTGWGLEYSLTTGETAAACCPRPGEQHIDDIISGFFPTTLSVSNTYAATCINVATSSSFSTVVCDDGTFTDFSLITIPNDDMNTFTVYAPLYQLNFQASDIPVISTSTSPTKSEPASPSSTGSSMPSSTSQSVGTSSSPSASDPVASLIPTSLRSSTTTSSTAESSGPAGPSSGDNSFSDGGLKNGAKIGIGVGLSVGLFLLAAVIFVIWHSRRRDKRRAFAEDEKSKGPGTAPKRNGSQRVELGEDGVVELEGHDVQEAPATALSFGQQRQSGAIFELPADNAHTLISPSTPRQPWHGPGDVSPMTPTMPSTRNGT